MAEALPQQRKAAPQRSTGLPADSRQTTACDCANSLIAYVRGVPNERRRGACARGLCLAPRSCVRTLAAVNSASVKASVCGQLKGHSAGGGG